jgi:hypothetical protein
VTVGVTRAGRRTVFGLVSIGVGGFARRNHG